MGILPDCDHVLNIARSYNEMGFCVVPLYHRKKRPAIGWKKYQQRRPNHETLTQWFAVETRNIGVVCGPVSGDLVIRDFDRQESYCNWAKRHVELAEQLPTVKTNRGHHVYCRADSAEIEKATTGNRIIHFGDGELRGGGYCLAPPSIHPSGHRYHWIVSLQRDIPHVDLEKVGFLECWSSVPKDTSKTSPTPPHPLHVSQDSTEEAIRDTVPTGPGERNRCVFHFARRLKALVPDYDVSRLQPIVRRWHSTAFPVIRTKQFAETWTDFLVAWKRCKPVSSKPFVRIIAFAAEIPIPPRAAHHCDPRMLQLIQICRALQKAAGANPFFLACRKAGELIGTSKSEANRMLKTLRSEGILRLVRRGTERDRQASEYLYCE